jgi:hypothetical protein
VKFSVRGDGVTAVTSTAADATAAYALLARATAEAAGSPSSAGFAGSVLRLETVKAAATNFYFVRALSGSATSGSSGEEKFSVRGDGSTLATSAAVGSLSVPVLTARASGASYAANSSALRVEVATTGADATGNNFYLVQVGLTC